MPKTILWQWKLIQLTTERVGDGDAAYDCEIARRSPGVRVICEQNGRILLSKEFRREHNEVDLRLPGGKVFDSLGEFLIFTGDLESAARDAAGREMLEECWLHIENLELFHVSHCGTSIDWDLYYFSTSQFSQGERIIHPGEEGITYEWYTYDEVFNLLVDGHQIKEDRTVGVLFTFLARKNFF